MASLLACFKPWEPPIKVGRIEPKQFYASERTFITWLSIATTIGSVSSGLVAFGMKDAKHASSISVLASVLTIMAIVFCLYATNTYFWRRRTIRRKEDGNYDDPFGPMMLAITLVGCYASVFTLGIMKLSNNDAFLLYFRS